MATDGLKARFLFLLAEAIANLRSAGALGVGIVSLLAALLTSALLVEQASIFRLKADLEDAVLAGGNVAIASAEDGSLPSRACDALAKRSDVVAAGGVRFSSSVFRSVIISPAPRTAEVTGGLLKVWDPTFEPATPSTAHSVILGAALAEEYSLGLGSVIEAPHGIFARVSGVIDSKDRFPQAERLMLVIAAPSEQVSEFWVEFQGSNFEASLSTLRAALEPLPPKSSVRPLRAQSVSVQFTRQRLVTRPSRHLWMVLGFAFSSIIGLALWLRRAELALYIALGLRKSEVAFLAIFEGLALIVPAVLLGGVVVLACSFLQKHPMTLDIFFIHMRTAGSALLVSLPVLVLASLLVVRKDVAGMLKDRR